MSVVIYKEKDADPAILRDEKIAIIGYGSQGRTHALNLKDSGLDVRVGLYKGSRSLEKAREDGLKVMLTEEAVQDATFIMLLTPDPNMPDIYKESVEQFLGEEKTLAFAHGFNVHYGEIVPPHDVDVILIGPNSPGPKLREAFLAGNGTPCLFAVHQDYTGKAKKRALAYARALGCLRIGAIETTFQEETETDLFGEQAVLCGGVPELIKTAYEVMIEAGYKPEIAYLCCLYETKLLVDMMVQKGIAGMKETISRTAEWGSYVAGHRIINGATKQTMKNLLFEIQKGVFAEKWMQEFRSGALHLRQKREEEQNHPLQKTQSGMFTKQS